MNGSPLFVLFVLGLYATEAAAAAPSADLEALAWAFRFTHSVAHTSPLLPPLQRTLARMQQHVALEPAGNGLCFDECGQVERLAFWGSPGPEEDPEQWAVQILKSNEFYFTMYAGALTFENFC
jgi:hypothetical protein